ncbi:MAG: hypothetical protein ABI620_09340 [Chloroflexota bacterium]
MTAGLAGAAPGVPASGATQTHRVGAATRDITPPLTWDDGSPVLLAGFWPARPASAVHSQLCVRAVAIAEPDGPPVVLAVADLIGLPRSLVLGAREIVEARGDGLRAVLAATHVHSGPDTIGFWGPDDDTSGVDTGYLDRVRTAFVEAVFAAAAGMVPVTLSVATARVPDVARNARQPEIVDDEVAILRAVDAGGRTVATLLDFPCHPEVLDGDSTLISSDYAGHLCRSVERDLGGVAVFAAGALGAMMTPDRDVADVAALERMGARIAKAALGALGTSARVLGPGVRFDRQEVQIPLGNPVFEAATASGLVEARDRGPRGEVVTNVSLIEIGGATGLRLAAVPGELAPTLGLPLKRSLGPAVGVVVGLADDELGYILDPVDYAFPDDPRDPGGHYEETMSVGREAGPVVTDAIASLLATQAARTTQTGGTA